MSLTFIDRQHIMFPGCPSIRPLLFEEYHFMLTVYYIHVKACHTPLVIVPTVNWNDVVVHAIFNIDLDI
jgi:hypothetical protein